MSETIFKPKYSPSGSFDVLGLCLLLIVVSLLSFIKFGVDLTTILAFSFLILSVVNFSESYIRRVIFTDSYFIVEKYVWPSKKIAYSDVIDFGFSKVKTRKGDVSFAAMDNAAELHALFSEFIQEGIINRNLFENKAVVEELALKKSFLPAVVITQILNGAFLIYWFYNPSRFSILGFWLVILLIILAGAMVMLSIYWINKKRIKLQ
ncbi:MAG: hypothetical protein JNM55_12165 [Anaerolineales bacterium]|nr:hypothetical protein [Anaerolineales bacterium]